MSPPEDAVGRSQDEASRNRTSEWRVELIRNLAAKLLDQTVLNTAKSRADCRQTAVELILLLDEEEVVQQAQRAAAFDQHDDAILRLAEAIRGCRAAGEQAELTRLFTMSERMHRQKGEGTSG
jgi:ribosomal protein L17